MTTSNNETLKASEFDAIFDKEDASKFLDTQSIKARYPTQRISIDFPKTIIENVDKEAAKIGVTRTALIKMWVSQHLPGQPEHRTR